MSEHPFSYSTEPPQPHPMCKLCFLQAYTLARAATVTDVCAIEGDFAYEAINAWAAIEAEMEDDDASEDKDPTGTGGMALPAE